MKFFRIAAALVLFVSLVLNTTPENVLDLFHDHEHGHDCGTTEGLRIEDEHIHCHIPHWYFLAYDIPEITTWSFVPDYIESVSAFRLSELRYCFIFPVSRGPPAA